MMLVASSGQFCDCCGVCADTPKCIRLVEQRHRCKETIAAAAAPPSLAHGATSQQAAAADATGPPPSGSDSSVRSEHLWVKGNLPMHCVCFVCDEDVDYHAEPGLYGYRCCWCQRATHTECFARIGGGGDGAAGGAAAAAVNDERLCDFGPYRDMIIPPSSVQAVAARGRRRIRVTAPVGVADWRPLFVIGEHEPSLV